jgi:FMN phosphatase YigB (HAD superfamily)
MNLSGIRNIIFDLGAVLFDIDYQLTQDAFAKLDISDVKKLYSKALQHEVFDLIETGRVTTAIFCEEIRKMTGKNIPDSDIILAWNAMLIGMTEDKIELLQRLGSTYNLYLLSNTNEIHLQAVKERIETQVGYERFARCFKKLYFSNEIGLRKPHPECFEYVLKDAGIRASETLFIDDSPQHVEGARKAGLHAYHLADGEGVTSLFKP